jgi:threonine dehydratase
LIGATVYFKCENLQNTGAFKFRGAINNTLQLGDAKKIVTVSCGNHGKALALIGKKLGLDTTVVMQGDSFISKQNAVK